MINWSNTIIGNKIFVGTQNSPWGPCFVATDGEQLLRLEFINSADMDASIERVKRDWPSAVIEKNEASVISAYKNAVEYWKGSRDSLKIATRGTSLQQKVWQSLVTIKRGTKSTYQTIAEATGNSKAARAVGSAIGKNPISLVVPCHRVIRKDGNLGGYAWGLPCKIQILQAEGAL